MAQNNTQHQISDKRLLSAFILGCAFFAYGFVHRVAPSVMTAELMRDFSVGGSALGSLSAMYFYAYVLLQLPVGLLMDRFGPRRLMASALMLCGVASICMASSNSLLAASVSRLVIGGSVAFAFVGTLTILTRWFLPQRFSMYAGILQSSGMVGAMLGQAPLRVMVETSGWRGSLLLMGLLALCLAGLVLLVVPRREFTTSRVTSGVADTSSVRNVLLNPHNWLCVLVGFGLAAPMLGFAALWAVPWLTTIRGLSETQSAGVASMVFMGWLIAAPVAGWLSDRIDRRKPVVFIGSAISLVGFLVILFVPINSPSALGLLCFLQGAGGSTMVICFTLTRLYNASANTSAALGLLNTFVVGSGAVMQPLIGVSLDSRWHGAMAEGARVYESSNYLSAFMLLVAANSVALVASALLRETR